MFVPLRVVRVVLVGVSWLCLAASISCAEDAPSAAPPDLDKVGALFAQQDADFRKACEDLRTLIETEVQAKRMDIYAAQNILGVLRINASSGAIDFNVLNTARLTMQKPNDAVAAAVKKLSDLTDKIEVDRAQLSRAAVQAARGRALEVARTAKKVEDIDPTIAVVESLKDLIGNRANVGIGNASNGTRPFWDSLTLLRQIRSLLEARDSGDPNVIERIVSQMQMSSMSTEPIGWTPVDAQMRVEEVAKPFADAAEAAQATLDQALIAQRPSSELAADLDKLEEKEKNYRSVRPRINIVIGERKTSDIYRTLVALAKAAEDKDVASMRANLTDARRDVATLGAERAYRFAPLLQQWQKQVAAVEGPAAANPRDAWPARLTAIQRPEELQAFAREVQQAERDQPRDRDPDFPRGLGEELNALAAAWSSGNPDLMVTTNRFGYDFAGGAYGKELYKLREKIQRDVLSRALHAPELLKSPLADQPLPTALDNLTKNLSEAREWRRLLEVFEARTNRMPFPADGSAPANDTVTAIRAYLAGQNFELAEQWSDAILSYKAVLASAAEPGPIKEAAERLKVLAREHPQKAGVTSTQERKSSRH